MWAPPSGPSATAVTDGPISPWRGGVMTVRGTVSATVVLFVLLVYVTSIDLDASEGANIGAGVLFLAVLVSLAMLPFAAIHEVVSAIRGRRIPR